MITQTADNQGWIYLSPHLDDAVLSCGGLIAHQLASGEKVEIWTVCAGDPPPGEYSAFARNLHRRWQLPVEPVSNRRREDQLACQRLGVPAVHLPFPDCIYRRSASRNQSLYATEEAIFGEIDPSEEPMIQRLAEMFAEKLVGGSQVVSPMGIGGHVDHKLTRAAAEALGWPLWYYADFPYVAAQIPWKEGELPTRDSAGWSEFAIELDTDEIRAWEDAVAAYGSQIPIFWSDEAAMRTAIRSYYQETGKARLWG